MQPAYKLAPHYAGGAGDLALMAQTPEQLSSAQDARLSLTTGVRCLSTPGTALLARLEHNIWLTLGRLSACVQ